MSDNLTERMLNMAAGLSRDEPAEVLVSPDTDAVSADVSPDTAGSDAAEHQTLDEAFAALDGKDTPQETEQAGETEQPDAPLSPEETIAALQAEVEKFRAEEAQRQLEEQDYAFEDSWDDAIAQVQGRYEKIAANIRALGQERGKTEEEIKAVIYDRVILGNGLVDENKTPMLGYIAWQQKVAANRQAESIRHYARKNEPSVLEQMAQTYNLTDADKTALAGLAALPREQLDAVAKALASKNQNLTHTLQTATKQARQNVAAKLSNGIGPGSPAAPPPKKPYEFTHDPRLRHEETTLVAARLGMVRR